MAAIVDSNAETDVGLKSSAREKQNKRTNDARKKRQAADKDAQSPPDPNSNLKKPKNSKVSYCNKLNLKPSPSS